MELPYDPEIVAEDKVEAHERPIGPNWAALVVLGALVLIWYLLSPIWMPLLSLLGVLLEPVLVALGYVFLALAATFLCGFTLAAVGMLLGGAIPSDYE
ncbi:MAG TPA: hypothetical protein VLT90_07680 [Terriglobales bacterium]|nr:hypothetical protein [Terriglobales bacterium]